MTAAAFSRKPLNYFIPSSLAATSEQPCAPPRFIPALAKRRRTGYYDGMAQPITLGHSPDPDDAFMFYGLAKELIPTHGLKFEHVLQDIQTLNERATRGELDVSAISIHAYASVSGQYALLPSGASMGDGYGPMLVARRALTKAELAGKKIAVPGTMTSAFLALQLWLERPAADLNYGVVPFDRIFQAVRSGEAEAGLIIHEGQLTYADEGLALCQDLGAWWKETQDGLPLPLGGNVVHKRLAPAARRVIAEIVRNSIRFGLEHRADAVAHALPWAREMGREKADQFVGMYVNDWTLDYGERGREAIRRFLGLAHRRGLLPRPPELEFVV
jgi:1,4-dihydroxy-6-naphthoate synthase